jgi:hypothetical protein
MHIAAEIGTYDKAALSSSQLQEARPADHFTESDVAHGTKHCLIVQQLLNSVQFDLAPLASASTDHCATGPVILSAAEIIVCIAAVALILAASSPLHCCYMHVQSTCTLIVMHGNMPHVEVTSPCHWTCTMHYAL